MTEEHCMRSIANVVFRRRIRLDELKFFEDKKAMFCSGFVSGAKHQFFVWFVTNLREVAMEDSDYDPMIYDQVFITFLDVLTYGSDENLDSYMMHICHILHLHWYLPDLEKFVQSYHVDKHTKIRKIVTHLFGNVEQTEKQSKNELWRTYDYHLRCASSVLAFWDTWVEASKKSENFDFPLPKSWSKPVKFAKPYEHHLRSRWPSFLLMMNLSKDDVVWWSAPEAKIEKSNSFSFGGAGVAYSKTGITFESGKKPAGQKTKKAGSKKVTASTLVIPTATSASGFNCAWPPSNIKHCSVVPTNHNFYEDLQGIDEQLWKFCEQLLITPLASRYHSGKSSEMLYHGNSSQEPHFMAVAAWFTMWSHAFGPQAMDFIEEEYLKNINLINSCVKDKEQEKIVKNWLVSLKQGTDVLEEINTLDYAPKNEDFAETLKEILLEPKIWIQLPWQPVLLQQWLAFALIEVLKFELSSMEVRHWPLPEPAEECARELLTLIATTKQRILWGLHICAQQVFSVPVTPADLPATILDQVVLPSLPVLEFLCSGNAYSVLEGIKRVAFAKSHPLKNRVLVPESSYLVSDNKLEWFYNYHYWHIFFWLDDEFKAPMSKVEFEPNTKNNTNIIPPKRESSFTSYNKFSLQEETFLDMYYGTKWDGKIDTGKVRKMLGKLDFLLNHLLKTEVFLRDQFVSLQTHFKSAETKASLQGLKFAHLPHLNETQLAVVSSCLFKKINARLSGFDGKQSLLSWLVHLSGEVVEREQMARVSSACATILQQTPVCPGIPEAPPEVLELLLISVRATQFQCNMRNREWLWTQLPSKWRFPVLGQKLDIRSWCPMPADTLTSFETKFVKNLEEFEAFEFPEPSNIPELEPLPNPALKLQANRLRESILQVVESFEVRIGQILVGSAQHNFTTWNLGKENCSLTTIVMYIVPCYVASLLKAAQLPSTSNNLLKIKRLTSFVHEILNHKESSYLCWARMPMQRNLKAERMKHRKIDTKLMYETNPSIVGRFVYERIEQYMYAYVNLGEGPTSFEGVFGFQTLGESLLHFRRPEDQNNFLQPHAMENFGYNAWEEIGWNHMNTIYKVCAEAWQWPVPGMTKGVLSKVFQASVILEVVEFILQCQGLVDSIEMFLVKHCVQLKEINAMMIYWRFYLLHKVVQSEGLIEASSTEEEWSRFASEAEDMMYKYWVLIRDTRKVYGASKELKKGPTQIKVREAPVVVTVLDHFYKGEYNKIADILQLNCSARTRKCKLGDMVISWYKRVTKELVGCEDGIKSQQKKKKKVIPKPGSSATGKPGVSAKALNACRGCKKTESKQGAFLACEECIKDKYPDINYYCSKTCKTTWWEKEHMVEHLEFSLGLTNFN